VEDRVVHGLAVREWGDPAEPGILLWPGLGATGAYFTSVAQALPGRAVIVDPPGFGRSAPPEAYTNERLIESAAHVVEACDCRAMVGHSLGAYLAAAIAGEPPAGLRAVVLIDGGFLDAETMAEFGMPTTAGRAELIGWLETNAPCFPDWETAIRELPAMFGSSPTPELEAYVRELLAEIDGEIRDPTPADRMADLLLAVLHQDIAALAARIAVPALLIACGAPAHHRPVREKAWRAFASASPLVELHVAENWGHNPILADPDASSRLIADWLQRHL
jgi:pimeloyl-ACP methyl ester carboxylesterase